MSLADYHILYSGGLAGGAPSARTFGELGVTAARIVTNAGGEDYAEITVDASVDAPGMPFLPLARHDVYAPGGSAPVFTGWLLQLSRQATADRQQQTYRLDGPMSLLAGVTFQQPWAFAEDPASAASAVGSQTLSRVILNLGTFTVADQITQIWEWFATQAAGPALGPLADAPPLAALKPPEDEQADLSCAEGLRRQLRWCPQVTARWAYGAGGPTLRFSAHDAVPAAAVGPGAGAVFVPPGAASAACGAGGVVIDAMGGRLTRFQSTARYDLLLREVTILRVGETTTADANGGTKTWLTRSPDTSVAENGSLRRLVYTCKLRGASDLAPAELPPPDGLAAAVHASFKELTYSLQWTVVDAALDWELCVGLAVGVRNAGDTPLAGSRAIIQRITRDLGAGTTTCEAGPPAASNSDDLTGLGGLVNPMRSAVRHEPNGGPGEQRYGCKDRSGGPGGGGGSAGA